MAMNMSMTQSQGEAARRNMKDFLTMYNTFTESCFNSCVRNFNYRHLIPEEKECTEKCTAKLVNINHRLISVYMELNPINRRFAEQETAAASGQGDQAPPITEETTPPPGNLANQVQQVFGEETQIRSENGETPAEGGNELQTRIRPENGETPAEGRNVLQTG